jgi:hypothetical protein
MRLLSLLLSACCLVSAAEGDGLFKEGGEAPAEPKPAPADPKADPAPAAPVRLGNVNSLAAVSAYAQSKGLAVSDLGSGPLRIRLLGKAAYPQADKALELGKQALLGLETWTGKNGVLMPDKPADDEILWIAVFPDDGAYSGFIDFLGSKGRNFDKPDLTKKAGGFPLARVMCVKPGTVQSVPLHYAVYTASCLTLDAFYGARKQRPPAWIREGCGAELQRLLCDGKILMTTIDYEIASDRPKTEDWGAAVAELIAKRSPQATTASEVMRTTLEALAPPYYYQMWSFFAYTRGLCGAAKGPKNKFLALLEATAGGTSSDVALKQVLGRSDPALTGAWRAWATGEGSKL